MPRESSAVRFVSLQAKMRSVMAGLRERERVLYQTGIGKIDHALGGGITPGELCVVGASTSHGKTLFGLQWSYCISLAGHPVLIVSEEMNCDTLAERAILQATETEQQDWRQKWDGVFDDVVDWEDAHRGAIMVPEVPVHSIDRAVDAIEQAVEHFGVKAVIVDYLQLLSAHGQTKYEQVSNVSRQLKQAAVEFNVAVVALAQLNRTVDTANKGIPQIHHLSDSGQIERDADVVLLLQWPHRTDRTYQPANEYRVFVAKNRNRGIRGDATIILRIYPMRQMISEPEITDHRNYHPEFAAAEQELF
jgi:replicative DNA helicase